MAVETEGSRLGAGGREARRQSLSVLAAGGAAIRNAAHELAAHVANRVRGLEPRGIRDRAHSLAAAIPKALADPRALLVGLRAFILSGPLVRFFTRTLQRRIILANTIGLAILLGGIFYLSQY